MSVLELHRWEPTLDSGEPLICLKEKALDFADHYVDLIELEQHRPQFLRLNATGQVPVLVHDGRVITEAGLQLLYLEDAFPRPALMPRGLADQYRVHFWVKYVEERMAPYTALIGWHRLTRPTLGPAELERARRSLDALPEARRGLWRRALDGAGAGDDVALGLETLAAAAGRLEETLGRSTYLAGEAYSLADIAVVLTARALRAAVPDVVSVERTPRTLEWLARIEARPAVREALSLARTHAPDRVFAPGPEPPRWG